MLKPRIVLSGVNFVEGGPLAIFHDALACLSEFYADRYDIIALVHRKGLFDIPNIEYMEFPEVKLSWAIRVRFEYKQCQNLSEKLKPLLWLSMHDMTPNVTASVRAVYCHNPAPFYDLPPREAMLDPYFFLFRFLYRFVYRINIRQNNFVVVQQEWMRRAFLRRFSVRRVIVAHPSLPGARFSKPAQRGTTDRYVFFYPALARTFKNFDLLLRAVRLLQNDGVGGFELRITVDGSENRYTGRLREEFSDLQPVVWLGLQTRKRVEELYAEADCLLFPSKLETWGMPISEWKLTGKPMLVSDLPYAHETVDAYDKVSFIDPNDPDVLASKMIAVMLGQECFQGSPSMQIAEPFAKNWFELFRTLLNEPRAEEQGA